MISALSEVAIKTAARQLRSHVCRVVTISRRTNYTTVEPKHANAQSDPLHLTRQLAARIKAAGPISVADYMKEVLISPNSGYYMNRDVFGEHGDFITSPEISQVFGEMLAVWLLNEWSKCGSPKPVQLIELGPGRGTLCQDLLRVFKQFDALRQASVALVEISPVLSDLQARRLCTNSEYHPDEIAYRSGISMHCETPVTWYRKLEDVPAAFSIIVAHEFFDALPVHKFRRQPDGGAYREVLVDVDPKQENSFRFIQSREETPMQKVFLRSDEKRPEVEVSPESILCAQQIANRIQLDGGIALIADYGHDGDGGDTFRAFRKHKLHDPLVEPGTADLTADVNFDDLKRAALSQDRAVVCFGPCTQRHLLTTLGGEARVQHLTELEGISDEQRNLIRSGYKMLTDDAQMGARFKFMCIGPRSMQPIYEKYPPTGFHWMKS